MADQHPITPPADLIRKWNEEAATAPMADQRYIATQAARWGADLELKACAEWVYQTFTCGRQWANDLRAARRPKPPSLKEQALVQLQAMEQAGALDCNIDAIRRALEQLDD